MQHPPVSPKALGHTGQHPRKRKDTRVWNFTLHKLGSDWKIVDR